MNLKKKIAAFNELLQRQIPGATVSVQALGRVPELRLALLDSGFDDRALPQAVKNRLMDDPPYWIFCWASGHALAELLLSGQLDVSGKTVLDFGCGCGVGAIAAGLAGAATVYACDIDPTGRRVTELNAALNKVSLEIISDVREARDIDMLLAADVLYEAANYHFLELFTELTPDVLVADSRLKSMPDPRYQWWRAIDTVSYPDFNEALEFNRVNFYRTVPGAR
ncbi:MAG: 50S ribosomal protein L11 methyltransferase [Ketobacteraceae bacterium]|nr:50S ribosomal protein L11 methyltransferase [Ketobacteraceae bacterium]